MSMLSALAWGCAYASIGIGNTETSASTGSANATGLSVGGSRECKSEYATICRQKRTCAPFVRGGAPVSLENLSPVPSYANGDTLSLPSSSHRSRKKVLEVSEVLPNSLDLLCRVHTVTRWPT